MGWKEAAEGRVLREEGACTSAKLLQCMQQLCLVTLDRPLIVTHELHDGVSTSHLWPHINPELEQKPAQLHAHWSGDAP